MKRFTLYIGIIIVVASCSLQEKEFATAQQDDMTFYASFEQPSEGTRVYANEDLLLRWTADDRVSIFNKITYNQEYRFIGQTGDYEGGFNKVDNPEFMTGSEIPHVISVYPFQRQTRVSENEIITVSLSAEQSYAQNSFGLGANTMVSVSSGNLLQYKTVGGFLVINLYGERAFVKSITLRGNNGEKLAGKATITMPLDGMPTATMTSDASEEITLTCDTPVPLGATTEESTSFWFVIPPVSFTKGFTITIIESEGKVFEKSTSRSVSIERNMLSKMSPIEAHFIPVQEAVDMGLSVKWASFNLGASKPEESGDYFAWGETEPYYSSQNPFTWKPGKGAGYSWSSYKWCMGADKTLIKYCPDSSFGYEGFTDGNTVLQPEDDAASIALGGFWRTPTAAEWTELSENCSWSWTNVNGVYGRKVTSRITGNSIFLPAAGQFVSDSISSAGNQGHYWSSSLYETYPVFASACIFSLHSVNDCAGAFRCHGYSIRPVYNE